MAIHPGSPTINDCKAPQVTPNPKITRKPPSFLTSALKTVLLVLFVILALYIAAAVLFNTGCKERNIQKSLRPAFSDIGRISGAIDNYNSANGYVPSLPPVEGNSDLSGRLGVALEAGDLFVYEVIPLRENEITGYKIVAHLTRKGKEQYYFPRYESVTIGDKVIFIYPSSLDPNPGRYKGWPASWNWSDFLD
jgi:hypothetical protein